MSIWHWNRNAASTPFNISGIVMLLLCICIQINGAFGVDFSTDVKDAKTAEECLRKVGVGLLSHGKGTIIFVLLNDPATWGTNYILPYLWITFSAEAELIISPVSCQMQKRMCQNLKYMYVHRYASSQSQGFKDLVFTCGGARRSISGTFSFFFSENESK